MLEQHEFELESGRLIRIISLDQWQTYCGLYVGLPTHKWNERLITWALEHAKERWHYEPLLIRPEEKEVVVFPNHRRGTAFFIPEVTCVAEFGCTTVARDESMDGSALPLVWFQPKFAFPIDDEILLRIQSLDWEKHASDFLY